MDELVGMLLNGMVSVKFTKVDGTERDMTCTLNESLIPASKMPKGNSSSTPHDGVVAVFCVDKQEWRSFRRDSVISYIDSLNGVDLCSVGNS